MTTVADLITATRSHLQAASQPELNRLTEPLDATETDVDFEFPAGGITRGAVLSIDLEQVYVWSVTGQTATVQRAFNGTVAAEHATGALFSVNDPHPANVIFRLLEEEIRSYSSPSNGLFQVGNVDLVYSPTRSGYDLTTGDAEPVFGVLSVYATGILTGDLHRIERWQLITDQANGVFPSSTVLRIIDGTIVPGKPIRVVYKTAYSEGLTALSDDVRAVTGLQDTAHDIPPLGAAARILAGRESRRNRTDTQPEPRQATDVPPGANTGASRSLLALRQIRLQEEAIRLAALYPQVSRKAG